MLCNGVLVSPVQENEPAVHWLWTPSRADSRRALSWAPCAVQQALLSCLFHPWCLHVSPRLPGTPIPLGIHVCSLRLCLYFCFANKITYKMAQTFQFSHNYIPVILFWVKTCRDFHLSCGRVSFSMEIIYSFVKFPTFDFWWVEMLLAKTPSLSTPEIKFHRTLQYPYWDWRIWNLSSSNDSATDAERTSEMSDD